MLRVVDALLLHDRAKREPEKLHSKVRLCLFLSGLLLGSRCHAPAETSPSASPKAKAKAQVKGKAKAKAKSRSVVKKKAEAPSTPSSTRKPRK